MRGEPNYYREVDPPGIENYRQGNCGIEYVYQFRAERSGPHLWINALTHGDEPCGADALDFLVKNEIRPRSGLLTLSFANVEAYENRSQQHPFGARFLDEDMNRVWNRLDSNEKSYELQRARQLRPIADSADYFVDLHAMEHPTRPLAIVGVQGNEHSTNAGIELSRLIGTPTLLVTDRGHAAGCRARDYLPFAQADNGKAAIVVECGACWSSHSSNVAIDVSLRAIRNILGIVKEPSSVPRIVEPPPEVIVDCEVTVTASTDNFQFAEPFVGGEIIEEAGTIIGCDGDISVSTPFDDCFLLMPCTVPKGASPVRFGRIRSEEIT